MKIENGIITLATGEALALERFSTRIEIVEVPHVGKLEHWLEREEEALIFSILVVPPIDPFAGMNPMHGGIPSPRDRAPFLAPIGDLIFTYNSCIRCSAPVRSLVDRYHGIVAADRIAQRLRLLVDLSAQIPISIEDGSFIGIVEPIHLRELLAFSFKHEDAEILEHSPPLQVEVQMLAISTRSKILTP